MEPETEFSVWVSDNTLPSKTSSYCQTPVLGLGLGVKLKPKPCLTTIHKQIVNKL